MDIQKSDISDVNYSDDDFIQEDIIEISSQQEQLLIESPLLAPPSIAPLKEQANSKDIFSAQNQNFDDPLIFPSSRENQDQFFIPSEYYQNEPEDEVQLDLDILAEVNQIETKAFDQMNDQYHSQRNPNTFAYQSNNPTQSIEQQIGEEQYGEQEIIVSSPHSMTPQVVSAKKLKLPLQHVKANFNEGQSFKSMPDLEETNLKERGQSEQMQQSITQQKSLFQLQQHSTPRKRIVITATSKNGKRPPTAQDRNKQKKIGSQQECQKFVIQNDLGSSSMKNMNSPNVTSHNFQGENQNLALVKSVTSESAKRNSLASNKMPIVKSENDDLFESLFFTVQNNLRTSEPDQIVSKSISTFQTLIGVFLYSQKYCSNYIQSLKNEVEKKYESLRLFRVETSENRKNQLKKSSQLISKFHVISQAYFQRNWVDKIDQLVSSVKVEIDQMNLVHIPKYFSLPQQIIQNYIFSIIVDSEKCARYAKIKQQKLNKSIQNQKMDYSQEKLSKVVDKLIGLKEKFQFIKVSSMGVKAKPVKSDLQGAILSEFGEFKSANFEFIGTVKNKCRYVGPKRTMRYQLSYSGTIFPSLSQMLSDTPGIANCTQEPFSINTQFLTERNLTQIITCCSLSSLFGDPFYQLKDPRVFICSSELKQVSIPKSRSFSSMKQLIVKKSKQKQLYDSVISRQSSLVISQKQIKRVKIGQIQQLRIEADDQQSALIQEVTLQNLMESKIFSQLFKNECDLKNKELKEFYIVEEKSIFNQDSGNQDMRIVRRLNDFEVLFLILLNFKVEGVNQLVEAKFNAELLKKKVTNSQADNSQYSAKIQFPVSISHSHYFIVDAISDSSESIQKSYFIRVSSQVPSQDIQLLHSTQIKQEQCQWPNCLVINDEETQPIYKKLPIIGNALTSIVLGHTPSQQSAPSSIQNAQRKRPDSSYGRNTQEKKNQQKRLSRLPIVLDLELKDSIYLRFVKKFKLGKEKLIKQGTQQAQSNNTSLSALYSEGLGGGQSVKNNQKGKNNVFCFYHSEIDLFYSTKQQVQLLPMQLVANNFYKGLKNYGAWKEELKQSLAYDLLTNTGKGNFLKDVFHKLYNFSLNQSRLGLPNIHYLIELLKQQPQFINVLEQFINWIQNVLNCQKLVYSKNKNFIEANNHFIRQFQMFLGNFRQAIENEKVISNEFRHWVNNQVPKSFLREVYPSLIEIVQNKDVIIKFQQFQSILDRINNARSQLIQMKAGGQNSQNETLQTKGSTALLLQPNGNLNQYGQYPPLPFNKQDSFISQKQGGINLQNQIQINNQQVPITLMNNFQGNPPQQHSLNPIDKLMQIYGGGSTSKKNHQQVNLNMGIGANNEIMSQKISLDHSLKSMYPETLLKGNKASSGVGQVDNSISSMTQQSLVRKYSAGSKKELHFNTDSQNTQQATLTSLALTQVQQVATGPIHANSVAQVYSNGSPLSKSLKKAPFSNNQPLPAFALEQKQRANSAYKSRQLQYQTSNQIGQASNTYQSQSVNRPPPVYQVEDPYFQQYSNQLQPRHEGSTYLQNSGTQPMPMHPPKFPTNVFNTQSTLNSIYNTKVQKPAQPQVMNGGISSLRQQRNMDRQQNIVMTYSNAVPRIGSANPEKEKKKLQSTFYEKQKKGGKGGSSQTASQASERKKQIKLNNFVKMQ